MDNEPGNKVGPTRQGTYTDDDSLCNQDNADAHWDPNANGGEGGPVNSNGARIVQVPMVSVEEVAQDSGRSEFTVQNIVGMFIRCPNDPPDSTNFPGAFDDSEVYGYLMGVSDSLGPTSGPPGENPSFLVSVGLIR
jgi:hypothetical protein